MVDLNILNSTTKYPSIPTYHDLDPSNGRLLDEHINFRDEMLYVTEKIDGTNARVIMVGDDDFFIGSREELLYAAGDRILNPAHSIVPNMVEFAATLPRSPKWIITYYFEFYGSRVSSGSKNYTTRPDTFGWKLFDVSWLAVDHEVLSWPRDKIASWREHGGQSFSTVKHLQLMEIDLVPMLGNIHTAETPFPTTIQDTYDFLSKYNFGANDNKSYATLDETALGRQEGIVVRNADRSKIAKIRFEDYERTLGIRKKK